MTVSTLAVLLVAILLVALGFVIGGGIATLVTLLYIYSKGQQIVAQQEGKQTLEE